MRHVTHEAKAATLTLYYTNQLCNAVVTSWAFDVQHLYAQRPQSQGQPLTARLHLSLKKKPGKQCPL